MCYQLLSTECDGLNLLSIIIVRCVDNTWGMMPKSNKTDQLHFVAAICMFMFDRLVNVV